MCVCVCLHRTSVLAAKVRVFAVGWAGRGARERAIRVAQVNVLYAAAAGAYTFFIAVDGLTYNFTRDVVYPEQGGNVGCAYVTGVLLPCNFIGTTFGGMNVIHPFLSAGGLAQCAPSAQQWVQPVDYRGRPVNSSIYIAIEEFEGTIPPVTLTRFDTWATAPYNKGLQSAGPLTLDEVGGYGFSQGFTSTVRMRLACDAKGLSGALQITNAIRCYFVGQYQLSSVAYGALVWLVGWYLLVLLSYLCL